MPGAIGAAFIGCIHPHIFHRLALLSAVPDVTLIGCYDADAGIAGRFEREYSLCAFNSAQELLDHPGVHFVIIEGWDTENPGYARLAIEHHKAVLLEKPGAPNLNEMRALLSDVRAQPVPFQVGYQLRFSPVISHVQAILASGVLGFVSLARFHAAAPVGAAREPWQSVPGDLGGVVYTDGCHMIDLIVHLLGVPKRVTGKLLILPEGPPVTAHGFKHDTFSGHGATVQMPFGGLMYEDAGIALLDYGDKLATFDITGWEANPWVETWRIELHGTNGTLYAGLQPPWYRLYVRLAHADYEPGWHSWKGSHMADAPGSLPVSINYVREMEHMLARVRAWDLHNEAWINSAEAVIAVLDALYRSNDQGTAIDVELAVH